MTTAATADSARPSLASDYIDFIATTVMTSVVPIGTSQRYGTLLYAVVERTTNATVAG